MACTRQKADGTFRERLAPLVRRGRMLARKALTLEQAMFLVGTVYNFCTMHESLRVPATTRRPALDRTPAMAAAITQHRWSVYELLSFHIPPPRWVLPKQRSRRSRTLLALIQQWCN
jgi:hypothetical protein